MIAGQCSCSHYLPPCSRSMIGARYHRRLLTLGDTDLDHNSRPAASTSSGSDFVPSIGLASFRHHISASAAAMRPKLSHPVNKASDLLSTSRAIPETAANTKAAIPATMARTTSMPVINGSPCVRCAPVGAVPLGLVQTVLIYTGLERCRCLNLGLLGVGNRRVASIR